MAESVVSLLLEKLASFIAEETLLRNVRDEIAYISDELQRILPLLKDADGREDDDGYVKAWVKQIRDVAYDIEDVLDDFLFDQRESNSQFYRNLGVRRQLARKLQDSKERLQDILIRTDRYNFRILEQDTSSQQLDPQEEARSDEEEEEAETVSIDVTIDRLITWLENRENNSTHGILSVYGDGGLGKTTLVKKVLDSRQVEECFEHCFWLRIPQEFKIQSVLQDMISKLLNEEEKRTMQNELKNMETTQLKEMLKMRLQGKRYVAVFDDVRESHAWKDCKDAFREDFKCGSRIILTTRLECVFEESYGFEYKLPRLNSRDALNLFKEELFTWPIDLLELDSTTYKILKMCKGCPLAVRFIAALLKTKEYAKLDEVHKTLRKLKVSYPYLKLNPTNLMLSACFDDLPSPFQSCLMYFSVFPENYSIGCRRLLRLWNAEGFIQGRSVNTVEEFKSEELDELINRRLVDVEERDLTGRPKKCQVGRVLHEFITSKASERDFSVKLLDQQNDREGLNRASIISGRVSGLNSKNLSSLLGNKSLLSRLLSFIVFDYQLLTPNIQGTLIATFNILKVLDLGNSMLPEFPSGIIKLSDLRYLCLRSTLIRSLPSSIGILTSLQYLDMKHCPLTRLPNQILSLKSLRYLAVGNRRRGVRIPEGIESLSNLEYLSVVRTDGGASSNMVDRLSYLTRMSKLSIPDLTNESVVPFLDSVEHMKNLRSLNVSSYFMGATYLDLQNLKSDRLQKLSVVGGLRTCPKWFPQLDNLVKLTLRYSSVRDQSFLKDLQQLPMLVVLKLQGAFSGTEMYFEEDGFPSLHELEMTRLMNLNMVQVYPGAMPYIRKLTFTECSKLETVPLGIRHLLCLESIVTRRMTVSFTDSIKKQVWKTEHKVVILCDS